MFPYCLYCCTGNRCGTIESIERGDQEQEQIELLDTTNQRNSVLEIENEQGSYKAEEIEKDNSIDENEHEQITFVRNSEDSKESGETNVQGIKEEEKEFKASDDSNDTDDTDNSDDSDALLTKTTLIIVGPLIQSKRVTKNRVTNNKNFCTSPIRELVF